MTDNLKKIKSTSFRELLGIITTVGILVGYGLHEFKILETRIAIVVASAWLCILFSIDFIVGLKSGSYGGRGVPIKREEYPIFFYVRALFSLFIAIYSALYLLDSLA